MFQKKYALKTGAVSPDPKHLISFATIRQWADSCGKVTGCVKAPKNQEKELPAICPSIDRPTAFVYYSCMSRTITIDDEAYKLLRSLKQGPGDSFTRVIHRHVHKPLETCGEIADYLDHQHPPPKVDADILGRVIKERGRRSGGRK